MKRDGANQNKGLMWLYYSPEKVNERKILMKNYILCKGTILSFSNMYQVIGQH